MKINIRNKKEGYASLEVIAMFLIGFTLVLALLSIALNKKILIDSEITAYEKELGVDEKEIDKDDERYIFLENILYSVNNSKSDNKEVFERLDDKNMDKEISSKEILKESSLLLIDNNKFNLCFNEEESSFVLEEALENSINIYYYDYEIRHGDIYFKER